MSRAWQAERAMDREAAALQRDLNDGTISPTEYNRTIRELERDFQAAYEEDQLDAIDRVRDEWGR